GLPNDARAGSVDFQAHRRQQVARLLVRGLVGQRAVPAHAERLAVARRQRAEHGRHHRGDGSRDRHQESRVVVDRPPAIQFPVLRPGVLRSEGREDYRNAQGRCIPGEYAGVLELDGYDWRAEIVLAWRIVWGW